MTETSSHEPAALALENVGKRFGSVIALSDVSMSVPKYQVTCVLGDNGAGKSTLIKILSGVHTPSDGQMYVNGEPTTFGSPRVGNWEFVKAHAAYGLNSVRVTHWYDIVPHLPMEALGESGGGVSGMAHY